MSKQMFDEIDAEIDAISRAPRRKRRRRMIVVVLVAIFLFITAAVMLGNALS